MQTYRTMTAVMVRKIVPVASPPRNAPTSVAAFDVIGSITSCNSSVDVGVGCDSAAQVELHTLTMVAV